MNALMEISAGTGVDFWADHRRCFTIVQLQDRVSQVNEFVEYCRSALVMVYNTMFPRNPAPQDFAELMEKFSRVVDIRNLASFNWLLELSLLLLGCEFISRGLTLMQSPKVFPLSKADEEYAWFAITTLLTNPQSG